MYNIRKADWNVYECAETWRDMPDTEGDYDDLVSNFYEKIRQASDVAIPTRRVSKYFPKPWLSPELQKSRKARERLYQINRANRNDTNLKNWKRKRALHKQLIRESKRKSWMEFAETINVNTPPQVVSQRKINILYEDCTYYSTDPE